MNMKMRLFALLYCSLLLNATCLIAQTDKTNMSTGSSYEIAIPFEYDSLSSFSDGLASYRNVDGYWGFIDKKGKNIVPCVWKSVTSFSEGFAAVKDKSGKWGFIDKSGQLISTCKWDSVLNFREGLAAVENASKRWGVIDPLGNEVFPCIWKKIGSFCEGLAYIMNDNGKCGYIDKTGNTVIPCKWSFAFDFSEGRASVSLNKKFFLIDRNGKEVNMPGMDLICPFSDGLAMVMSIDKWQGALIGFVDKNGKVIIPMENRPDISIFFKDGLAAFGKKNWRGVLKGYVDKTGHEVIPFVWHDAKDFSENLAAVKENSYDGWGYINKSGDKVIPFIWKSALTFSEGLAVVQNYSGKWGAIRYVSSKGDDEKVYPDENKQTLLKTKESVSDSIRKKETKLLAETNVIKKNVDTANYIHMSTSNNSKITPTEVDRPSLNVSNGSQLRYHYSPKMIALVIGNSDYEIGRLKNPTNDAIAIKKMFNDLGIESGDPVINCNMIEMEKAIADFTQKAKDYDVAIFYFAGHAKQVYGDNYLFPIDENLPNQASIKRKCVSLSWIIESMVECGVKSKILILDACRENPYSKIWYAQDRSSSPSGLANINNLPYGVFLAFATQPNEVASDSWGKQNSVYTEALLKALKKHQSIEDVFREVKRVVSKNTNKQQVPVHFNNLDETDGNLYLNKQE